MTDIGEACLAHWFGVPTDRGKLGARTVCILLLLGVLFTSE